MVVGDSRGNRDRSEASSGPEDVPGQDSAFRDDMPASLKPGAHNARTSAPTRQPPLSALPNSSRSGNDATERDGKPKSDDALQSAPRREEGESYARDDGDCEEKVPGPEQNTTLPAWSNEGESHGGFTDAEKPPCGARIGALAESPCHTQEQRRDKELGQSGRQGRVTCAPHGHSMGR